MTTNILGTLGSSSGLDTQKLVSDLVAVQKAPEQGRIDARNEQFDAKLSGYGKFKSALSDFQKAVAPLEDSSIFNAKSINVPTTDVVTFNSLDAQAPAGNYQVEVTSIATNQTLAINSTETDANNPLGKSGNLTFKTGAWTYDANNKPDEFTENSNVTSFDIEVTAVDSLASIAKKINDADSKVLASVIEIDGKFQLTISSTSGTKNGLEITSDNSASLSGFEFSKTSNANVVETQKANDAVLKLNGLEITRESNNISDVINGLDFTLNKSNQGQTIAFSIEQDKSVAEKAIREFVDAYKVMNTALNALVGVSKDNNNNLVRGELSTDGATKNLVSRLNQTVFGTVNGLINTDAYSSLAAVGVNTSVGAKEIAEKGVISIDDEQFNKVIAERFDELAGLFSVSTTSSSSFVELNTGTFAAEAKAGKYDINISQAPTKGFIKGGTVNQLDFSSGSNNFKISVPGAESQSISLSENYNSIEQLAADLQSKINSDVNLKQVNAKVEITIEAGALKITSDEYGSSSKVSFTSATNDFTSKIGFSTSIDGVPGKNVQGTINGQAATGTSDILLPAFGSDAYGLNIRIKEGAPQGDYSVNFTRGLSGDLSLLISSSVAKDGQVAKSEELIEAKKKETVVDQEDLDRKMTAYQSRLSSQFLAMERVVASLNQTKSQLTGLIDRLPFTAKK